MGDNYGRAGATIAEIDDFLTQILGAGVYDAVVLQYGQNEVPRDPITPVLDRIRERIARVQAKGIAAFLVTLNPRAPAGVDSNDAAIALTDSTAYRRIIEFNDTLDALAMETGCCLIDTRSVLCDATNPLMPAKAGVSRDGLHMTKYGHYLWSLAAEAAFLRTMPRGPGSDLILDPVAAGNLYSNGGLPGTGGQHGPFTQQNGSPGTSGALPDKMRIGLDANSTSNSFAATTIVDDVDGLKAVRAAFTLANANATTKFNFLFTDNAAAGNSAIVTGDMSGKWVRGYVKVFVEAGGEYLRQLSLIVGARTAANANLFTGEELVTSDLVSPLFDASINGKTLWLITDPMLCPDTTQRIYLNATMAFGGTGSVVLHFSAPALREVPAP